ncbi:acyltransferase [Sphingomonas oligophenolica]|uniref:Acyltransferase n=2 Tax=Sphingomonas oligophenolica TaxID=301154 RepID=A0ABU9YB08_9SPHN
MPTEPAGRDNHLVRLDVLRFPLIVLIVYLHASGVTANFADGSRALVDARTVEGVQIVTGSIARIAVPLFFMMSGFLFFRGAAFSGEIYRAKLRSRAKSLLIPFLFWNLALFGLVAIAQGVPPLAPLFNGENQAFATLTPFQMIDFILGITHYPIAYQFWFIRDLMILVIMSPLLWLAARHVPWIVLTALTAAWIFNIWPTPVPAAEPTLFFYLGSFVAIRGWSLFEVDRLGSWLAVPFVLLLVALRAEQLAGHGNYLLHPTMAVGLVLALKASRWLAESAWLRDRLVALGSASFFVFAVHEPLVTIGKKLAFRALPMTAATVLATYAVLPVLVIGLALIAHRVLNVVAPGFLRLITGGR